MYTFLLVLLILDSIVLVAAILLQAGKGGGLAASFGGVSTAADSFIGTRQAGNLLTKASWWGGGIFLALAFLLQVMSARTSAPRSVLDQLPGPASAPTQPKSQPADPLSTPNAQPTRPDTPAGKGPAEAPK
ncbi:MAG: preprotein translocase subunit SecG [Gemmatimonadaceae bacterium]